MAKIDVKGTVVSVYTENNMDFISLTDMLRAKDGDFFLADWLRNRNTVEFLGIWEQAHNPDFNYGEFAIMRSQAGLSPAERLQRLNQTAIQQMTILLDDPRVRKLGGGDQ